jgi:hypothetical protein
MSAKCALFMMLFRQGNRKKSTHRTPLIWRLFPHLKSIMKGTRFADVVAIQECVIGSVIDS